MSGRFSSPEPSPPGTASQSQGTPVAVKREPLEEHQESPEKKRKSKSSPPSGGKVWDARPLCFRPGLDTRYSLPDGWTKTVTTRKSGVSVGFFDVYLTPPRGGRLRSARELYRFILNNPDVPLDPDFVNMEPPIDERGGVVHNGRVQRLREVLASVRAHGKLPDDLALKSRGKRKRPLPEVVEKVGRKVVVVVPEELPHGIVLLREFAEDKVIKMEKLFKKSQSVPTPNQARKWADRLGLSFENLTFWFKRKWESKIREEAANEVRRMREAGGIPEDANIMISEEDVAGVVGHDEAEIGSSDSPEIPREFVTPDFPDNEVKVGNVTPIDGLVQLTNMDVESFCCDPLLMNGGSI